MEEKIKELELRLNNSIEYSEYLAEQLNKSIVYSEYLSGEMNDLADLVDKQSSCIDNLFKLIKIKDNI